MSDEKALLAAIWEHPHEDTPRLVYADWLQENGQPERAEFIRVQCELARLGEYDFSTRKTELKQREEKLLAQHGATWKAKLPATLQKRAEFDRGFPMPHLQKIAASKFLKMTTDDFAAAPLWRFDLKGTQKGIATLHEFPQLSHVGTLHLEGWYDTPEEVRTFANSPYVRNISELVFDHSNFGDDGLKELGAGSGLPHLRRLSLKQNKLTARGIEHLVTSPIAERLESLSLPENYFGPEGILPLARSSHLGRLQRLNIASCHGSTLNGRMTETVPVDGNTAKALCDSRHLRSLKCLAITNCGLATADIETMCMSRPVFRLISLNLAGWYSPMGDAGAQALAEWPALSEVRTLILHSNRIGFAGARALARSPLLKHVTELWLQGNPLLDDPMAIGELRKRFGDALRLQ